MRDPIHDELRHHFDQLKQERLAAGDTAHEAELYAHRRLGNMPQIQEEVQEMSLFHRFETLARHARFAARSFTHHGGAYLLATGILALGIGLSVAMFSLVHAVVLSPLPFRTQNDVHLVWKMDTQINEQQVGELAYPELTDLQANREVESVALLPAALYGNGRVLQHGSEEPVQIESCPTTPDLFKVLGVTPALGRDFTPADAGGAPVVILSDRVWRTHFGARPSVIGQLTQLNGTGHTIIGVMPPEVDFPRGAGLWLLLRPDTNRGMTWLQAVARVKPGVTQPALYAAMDRTFKNQIADFPAVYSRTQRAVVTPIADFLTGTSKIQLLLSLSASLLLLLSAGVSASNLFLSRTLTRRREVATRISLGASKTQVLAQFAVEGFIAATLATLAGSALAYGLIHLLVRLAPADIPRLDAAHLDLTALAFAAAIALLATIACMVGPAILLREKNFESLLRQAKTAGSRTGRRLQNAFVFSQAALTVTILAVGLLLFISYQAMLRTDVGFAHRDTLTMNLAVKGAKANPASRRHFYAELLRRLRLEPGVTSAAAVLLRPLEGPIGWDSEYSFEFEAGHRDPHLLTKANFEVVTPTYFDTVGTSLLSGRDFNDRDVEDSEKVLIISRTLAGRIRATGREPLGQRLRVFGDWRKVVGVVADARYRRVVEAMDDIYVPDRQATPPTNYLVIRGTSPAADLLALVRRTLKDLDPAQAIAGEATLGQLLERNTARNRFNVSIMLLFAAGAILLAAAGIHSVIGETVAVRKKEIAVKTALGASRPRLVSESIRQSLAFVAAGELAGLVAALLLAHAASGLLYSVTPTDPAVLTTVTLFVFLTATLASLIPAWAATNQDTRATLQGD
jgi:predicted permease